MTRLQERVHALYGAPTATFAPRYQHFVAWLQGEPFLERTLASAPAPELSAKDWIQAHVVRQGVDLSADEDQAVGELWAVMQDVAADNPADRTWGLGHSADMSAHGMDTMVRAFLETFVDPVISWLRERILTDDLLLHSLERYALEAAWFRQEELLGKYEADTGNGEKILDNDLRHQLLREGIDFPFSQVEIPSGKPDVVVPDGERKPLPIEVKIYDADNRGDNYVRAGFAQAIEYAHNYRRADAYLVIFDITETGLAVEGIEQSPVPFIRAEGVTVFVVIVPIGRQGTAGSRGRAHRKTINAEYITQV